MQSVSMAGDYVETLVYLNSSIGDEVQKFLESNIEYDEINTCKGQSTFLEIKSQTALSSELIAELSDMPEVKSVKVLDPVLPIMSRKNLEVPFVTCEEMLEYNEGKNLQLWELALHYESARGNVSHEEVLSKMDNIVGIMQAAIEKGLQGTEYTDRILGCQSVNFQEQMKSKNLVESSVLNQIILSVTAIMEVKSSMGVIVAAPTAGSCGALPGACLGTATALNHSREEVVRAMLAAGLIGVFIAQGASFAAEVGGCQAECGSGACMAASVIVTLAGGSLEQCLSASSNALQNSLGMICDPIGNRVEAPCLGRNVTAASNALSCANMALANYEHLIPLDEVIETMNDVSDRMARELRCTALGGLSITKTSKKIEAWLQKQQANLV